MLIGGGIGVLGCVLTHRSWDSILASVVLGGAIAYFIYHPRKK
jgi:hypothetical protein